mmetsp:Transcript_40221/g.110586  ORF Transcript_40221/g.110586 Transcript_40221/m.110586 type:complete len:217 (+) Transcript_40221:1954-2604(+)
MVAAIDVNHQLRTGYARRRTFRMRSVGLLVRPRIALRPVEHVNLASQLQQFGNCQIDRPARLHHPPQISLVVQQYRQDVLSGSTLTEIRLVQHEGAGSIWDVEAVSEAHSESLHRWHKVIVRHRRHGVGRSLRHWSPPRFLHLRQKEHLRLALDNVRFLRGDALRRTQVPHARGNARVVFVLPNPLLVPPIIVLLRGRAKAIVGLLDKALAKKREV